MRELERSDDPSDRVRYWRHLLRSGEEVECSKCGHPDPYCPDCHLSVGVPCVCGYGHCPRCGGLGLESRLQLAAFLGDRTAQNVIGVGNTLWPGLIPGESPELQAWVKRLGGFGGAVRVRAHLALARFVRQSVDCYVCEDIGSVLDTPCSACSQFDGVIRAHADWVECPDEKILGAVAEFGPQEKWLPSPLLALDSHADRFPMHMLAAFVRPAWVPFDSLAGWGGAWRAVPDSLARGAQKAIRDELVPWALGVQHGR